MPKTKSDVLFDSQGVRKMHFHNLYTFTITQFHISDIHLEGCDVTATKQTLVGVEQRTLYHNVSCTTVECAFTGHPVQVCTQNTIHLYSFSCGSSD